MFDDIRVKKSYRISWTQDLKSTDDENKIEIVHS